MSRSKKVLIVLLIIFLTIVSLNVYAKDDCDSSATTIDLSSFNTSNVTNMNTMFSACSARTGYARTQEDADRFNNSSNKPSSLVFVPN